MYQVTEFDAYSRADLIAEIQAMRTKFDIAVDTAIKKATEVERNALIAQRDLFVDLTKKPLQDNLEEVMAVYEGRFKLHRMGEIHYMARCRGYSAYDTLRDFLNSEILFKVKPVEIDSEKKLSPKTYGIIYDICKALGFRK